MSYITFKTISSAADLGSQVQQYASMYAIAKETGKTIVFPESSFNLGWGFKFSKLLDIPIIVKEESFFNNFIDIKPNGRLIKDESVFNLDPNINYNIAETFHLFHYWYPKYSDDITNWNWNPEYYKQALDLYKNIKVEGKELVSIHVRRGDYLLPHHHHFCKLNNDYYGEAIQHFIKDIEKYHFVIFSNDIEWCKENLIEGDMVTFINPGIDCVDLILMSLCDHNIIANSSFSWWAAFKNKNKDKTVICPSNYLMSYSEFSFLNKQYYPSTWKNIDNQA